MYLITCLRACVPLFTPFHHTSFSSLPSRFLTPIEQSWIHIHSLLLLPSSALLTSVCPILRTADDCIYICEMSAQAPLIRGLSSPIPHSLLSLRFIRAIRGLYSLKANVHSCEYSHSTHSLSHFLHFTSLPLSTLNSPQSSSFIYLCVYGVDPLRALYCFSTLRYVSTDVTTTFQAYGRFIFKNSEGYLHAQPAGYSGKTPWPSTNQVVESLAQMARLHWPAYISPTMFPNKPDVLPPSLAPISPLTSQAHPLITSLSCAALHPSDPSCTRTLLTFWLNSFPPMAHFFLVFYSALTVVPRFKRLYNYPVSTVRGIIARALRMSTFATGAISTAWASICFFQTYLPKRVLATQRFFLGGFFAGLWAWVERRHGRGVFLYSARASVDSLWKVGVKRRWWKAMKGGDVWVFVLAVMATGVVYERDSRAIREKEWRKGVSWIRGEGWRDWAIEDEMDNDDDDDDDDDDKDAPAEQFLKEE